MSDIVKFKPVRMRNKWYRTTEYHDELIEHINNYWGQSVAYHVHNTVQSGKMLPYGVPAVARTTRYTHRDIVRVKRSGRTWRIVK